jgi:hypothetical protein
MFPVEDARLRSRLTDELLQLVLRDNVKARLLQADGTYSRLRPATGEAPVRSQTAFQALARESAREATDPAFRFVPIRGPLTEKHASENGGTAPSQRSKPARLRSPRARKSSEPR